MDNEELREQYDAIYREKPDKWASTGRDNQAWFMLNKILGRAPKNLLDIGCGNGHTIRYFKERWAKTKYSGLDVSPEAIKIAMEGMDDVYWHVGEIERVDKDNEFAFDVLVCMGVAEHFDDIEKKLRYISKWLNPKGVFYLEVPNNLTYSDSQEEGYRESLGVEQSEWHLRKETWDNIIEKAGYVTFITRTWNSPYPVFMWILQKPQ